MLFVCDGHEVSVPRVFNYEGLADAAILLSDRVDISRTHCTTRDEVFFLRSSRRGRLREKVTEKLRIERVREEEKERGRIVRREV